MSAVEAIAADAIMGRLDLAFKTGITSPPLVVGGGLEESRQAAAAAVVKWSCGQDTFAMALGNCQPRKARGLKAGPWPRRAGHPGVAVATR
jgi:hypothetical protein